MRSGSAGRGPGLLRLLPEDRAVRLSAMVMVAWVAGFWAIDAAYVVADDPPRGLLLVAAVCMAVMLPAQLACSYPQLFRLRTGVRYAVLAGEIGIAFFVVPMFGEALVGLLPMVAGSVVLVLPRRAVWPVFAVVAAFAEVTLVRSGLGWDLFYDNCEFALDMGTVFALARLPELVGQALRSRAELTRLAVTHERLRFAGDLHDLLGYSLATIAVKCELASRLISHDGARARQEISEVLETSRQSLADVRTVALGYRPMSLAQEAVDAEGLLAATDIRADIRIEPVELPAEVDTVLATVLREGMTNLLRHGRARRCVLSADVLADQVCLRVSNDGAAASPAQSTSPAQGSGISSLRSRVHRLGGCVTAESRDGWFHLTARVPLLDLSPPGADPDGETAPALVPRAARVLTIAILLGYLVQSFSFLYECRPGKDLLPAGAALIALCLVLQAWQIFPQAVPLLPARYRRWMLLPQALLAFAPYAVFGTDWMGEAGLVAGTAFLLLPRRPALTVAAAAVLGNEAARLWMGETDSTLVIYMSLMSLMTALVVYAVARLTEVVTEVHESRSELARLAVDGERLRFTRELNESLGDALSRITLRCELANRLLPDDPCRAQHELVEILGMARAAGSDVRTVARGYRPFAGAGA